MLCITRRSAQEQYGGSAASLARKLQISEGTVRHWPMDEAIPEKYQLLLCCYIDPDSWASLRAAYRNKYGPRPELA